MFRLLSLFGLLAVLLSTAPAQIGAQPSPDQDVSLTSIDDAKFRPGDIWEYKTRSGEEKSRLTVLKVERAPQMVIVHIALDQIRIHNCTGGPEPDRFQHMPFERSALDASVTKRIAASQPAPRELGGYDEWKAAFLKKRAGVYTISVAQALDVAEATFQSGLGCKSGTPATSSTN